MDYVPKTRLNYDYWQDQDKNIYIRDHYSATYLESNYQYQYYLRCLKAWGLDSLWQLAQPDPAVWETVVLTPTERVYLKEHYWTAAEFEHYPVVGLDYNQVRDYFYWKTNMLNLAAYEAAGGTEGFIYRGLTWSGAKPAAGFPDPFSTKEYRYQTNDSTRLIKLFPTIRLPTAQEIFADLPVPKKTKGKAPKADERFMDWLKKQDKFSFLAYDPPKPAKHPTALQQSLERLGIRPVLETDLSKLKQRKDDANLPLLCIQEKIPKAFGIYVCSEEDLKMMQNDPNFNPNNLKVVVFDPKKAATISWVSHKGRLITVSLSDATKRPLFGFRGTMTNIRNDQ